MLLSSRYGVRGEGVAEESRPLENREANTELGDREARIKQSCLTKVVHTSIVSLFGDQPHGGEQVQNET